MRKRISTTLLISILILGLVGILGTACGASPAENPAPQANEEAQADVLVAAAAGRQDALPHAFE